MPSLRRWYGDRTMVSKITDRFINDLKTPLRSSKIYYDSTIKGLGICITKTGVRSFILNYRINGRERRIVIGSYPTWSTAKAKDRANKLRLDIDNGNDPLEQRDTLRNAWIVKDLFKEYESKHIINLAPRAQKDVLSMWRVYIIPALASKKLKDITAKDIDDLHQKISLNKPVRANRVLEVLRHALNLAMRWGEIDKNPANGFKRNAEQPKDTYLSSEQIISLFSQLNRMKNQNTANLFRLLIFTGSRLGETIKADWSQFDLENGIWIY